MTRSIKLWNVPDVVMIVLETSGVVYENQVKGNCCMPETAEGILAPLSPDYPVDARGRPAVDTLEERLGRVLLGLARLDAQAADAVDAILSEYRETAGIRVDRQRLGDSGEAWVHVEVAPNEWLPLQGFGHCRAVLTWNNSD